jgi:hypothetical protein
MSLKRTFEGRKSLNQLKTESYKKAISTLRPKEFNRTVVTAKEEDSYDTRFCKTVIDKKNEFCDSDMLAQIDKYYK